MNKYKPEPLKDKRIEVNVNTKTRYDTWHEFLEGDVKLAVDWLKEKMPNHPINKIQVLKIIDEAFPDLCPSGDLIADKQNPQNKRVLDTGEDGFAD